MKKTQRTTKKTTNAKPLGFQELAVLLAGAFHLGAALSKPSVVVNCPPEKKTKKCNCPPSLRMERHWRDGHRED